MKKRRRKARAVAALSIETDGSNVNPTDHSADNMSPPVSFTEEHEGSVSSPTQAHRSKRKSKKVSATDVAVDALNPGDVIESLESDDSKPVPRKKKKKKRKNISDAETNTSQIMNLEMMERRIPPPRLAPINHSVIQNPINCKATPPLRSKFPSELVSTENHTDLPLPPSGAPTDKKKRRRSGHNTEGTESSLNFFLTHVLLIVHVLQPNKLLH